MTDTMMEQAPEILQARPLPLAQHKPVRPMSIGDVRISVHGDLRRIEDEWRAFEKTAACTVFQTFGWLSKWQRHVGEAAGVRPVIVMGRDADGALLFLLPFAVETRGVLRRLTWLGHALCDYNAPLIAQVFLRDIGTQGFVSLWPDIVACARASVKSRIDLIDLDKMPETMAGEPKPFADLDVLAHPCNAHIATLGDDWERFYAAKRSSSTRKKERKRLRQLGERGEVRLVSATAPEDRAAILNTLIAQKSHWFARMGVNDFLARPGTRDFFEAVAADPDMQDIVHVSGLNVGDTVAAASVGLRFGGCYCLVLSSYIDSDLSWLGPGRTHLHELLRHAISNGLKAFDFTVGDEPYKRDWSDREMKLYDFLSPVTLKGRLAVMSYLAFRKTKRIIKRTPILWRAYTSLRLMKARWRGAAGNAQGPSSEAD
jgi:CelD/BcsL family acetyltransferase involved in cellulose biosynthesis